jgi:hypothetical protein
MQNVICVIDADTRIVETGGDWDDFAAANDGAEALTPRVLGRRLGEFVAGDAARMWLFALLDLARLTAEPVTRSYRCDSPMTKRFMEMTVTPESEGRLRLRHRLVREERMARPAPMVQSAAQGCVLRCSICNRLASDGGWMEPDAPQAPRGAPLPVVHTVCEACRDVLPRGPGGPANKTT